ncbi:MAG: hypothetical protein WBQ18_00625, partial [Solirubrobacteraceae bacterium]
MRRLLAFSTAALAATAVSIGAQVAGAAAAPSAPAHATARLVLGGVFAVGHNAVTIPGRPVEVQGTVTPYIPGQTVAVTSRIGSRALKVDRLRIKPAAGGTVGRFTETLRSPAAGIVRVTVTHTRNALMLGFLARRAFAVLAPSTGFGSGGLLVDLVQERLNALHIYVPQTGVFDTQTGLALDAYHRLLRAGVSQAADPGTISALLDGRGTFHVRYPG